MDVAIKTEYEKVLKSLADFEDMLPVKNSNTIVPARCGILLKLQLVGKAKELRISIPASTIASQDVLKSYSQGS